MCVYMCVCVCMCACVSLCELLMYVFLTGRLLCSSVRTRFNLHVVKTTRVLDKIEGQLYDSVFALSTGRITSIGPHGEFNWQVWGGRGGGGEEGGREGRRGRRRGKGGEEEREGRGRRGEVEEEGYNEYFLRTFK